MAPKAPALGTAVKNGMPAALAPLKPDELAAGTLAGSRIRGGSSFTDTLTGVFYPIVIDPAGNITINSSPNHLSSLVFHDTANANATDLVFYANNNTYVIAPNSATTIAMLLAILDRNTTTGANGIEIDTANRRIFIYSNGGGGNAFITWDNASLATISGIIASAASTTAQAGLRIPHGTAPTTPANGEVWTTTGGMFVRINGVTKSVNLT